VIPSSMLSSAMMMNIFLSSVNGLNSMPEVSTFAPSLYIQTNLSSPTIYKSNSTLPAHLSKTGRYLLIYSSVILIIWAFLYISFQLVLYPFLIFYAFQFLYPIEFLISSTVASSRLSVIVGSPPEICTSGPDGYVPV